MRVLDEAVLDLAQLKEITMNDDELMREVLGVMLDDTGSQLLLLDAAIQAGDLPSCRRLAHYSRGACANVGAGRAAAVCLRLEQSANSGEIAACSQSLAALRDELDALRQEADRAMQEGVSLPVENES
jgi:HPt (histidine-containing phosphotransfer) domain-containing protein